MTDADTYRDALKIAAERYARGEISRDEFIQLRTDLDGPTAARPTAFDSTAGRRPSDGAVSGSHEQAGSRDTDRAVVQIAEALQRLTLEALYVVVEIDPARNYYVQCLLQGSGHPSYLLCEAVSDVNLAEQDRLGEVGAMRLRELGWLEPTRERPNWHREFPFDLDFEEIAVILVQTLSQIYGYRGGQLALNFGPD